MSFESFFYNKKLFIFHKVSKKTMKRKKRRSVVQNQQLFLPPFFKDLIDLFFLLKNMIGDQVEEKLKI